MNLELISFKLCPFVQRSVITLLHKGVDFSLRYVDLDNLPDWFKAISPVGKVPLLRVGEETVLFESAVINEYLDEINPPSLHPQDALQRALNRAWIEFGSALFMNLYQLIIAQDREGYDKQFAELRGKMHRVEDIAGDGPYFNGDEFALIDAAYAPFFMRVELLREPVVLMPEHEFPKLTRWGNALLTPPAVQKSVVDEFPKLFNAHLRHPKGFLSTLLPA